MKLIKFGCVSSVYALMLTVGLLLLPTVAYAQEITLRITLPEAELIWKGIRKIPVEEVEQLMIKLRQQVTEQTQPPKPAVPVEEKKEPEK